MALLSLLLVFGVSVVVAQFQETVLVNFNHVWKYDQSGLELGTAWRTNDFDDSSWPSGPGLLGLETRQFFPSDVFPYPLSVRTPLVVSTTITSYYFRTTFQFSGLTNDLSLIASNFVDDGCVIYLNGVRVGGVRMASDYNAATFAQRSPEMEGQIDLIVITNLSLLRQEENCLAVEVHQGPTSSDVVYAMKLVALPPVTPPDPPRPLVIALQPESQTVVLDEPFAFSVGVLGDNPRYQWQKDGVNLANATTATYTNLATASAAAAYRVIITNDAGSVTSSIATLTVKADLIGPTTISATAFTSSVSAAIHVFVTWSEVVDGPASSSPARNPRNFTLGRLGTTETVPLTQILYSASIGSALRVDTSDPDWVIGGDYILTVSNVKDLRGNSIAPDSQIAVSWPVTNAIVGSNTVWSFHNSHGLEPDVAEQDWFATNYIESAFWSSGRGIFHSDTQHTPCYGALQTGIAHQSEPILFRTTFQRPQGIGSSATLHLRFTVDDGAVFYLNGREFYRTNMAPQGWLLDSSSHALANRFFETCNPLTLPVASLLPGTNWLGVAIYEDHPPGDGRVFFGLELTLGTLRTPVLPVEPTPTIGIARLPGPDHRLVLDWTGHGFALESTATFSNNLSYPLGPWIQVTNMANPYTNSFADPARFFRLKK